MIKLLKLLSGEEIIATIKNDMVDSVELDDAVALVYHQVGEGKMSVGFAPFMPYASGTVTLAKSAMCSKADPTDQILQEYNRVFSKIQVAPASALTKLN